MYPPGCAFHATGTLPAERTIVIGGHYRGGTSMVAGLLKIFGLPIGDRLDLGNNEDLDLRDATEEKILQVVATRNAEHAVWGWKDPGVHRTIRSCHSALRNPRFVFVLRDVFACAQAERWKGQAPDVFLAMKRKHEEQTRMLSFLDRIHAARRPLFVLSYDRALSNPERAVDQLAVFTGFALDPETRRRAIAFIEPERGHGVPEHPPASRAFLRGELERHAPDWLAPRIDRKSDSVG